MLATVFWELIQFLLFPFHLLLILPSILWGGIKLPISFLSFVSFFQQLPTISSLPSPLIHIPVLYSFFISSVRLFFCIRSSLSIATLLSGPLPWFLPLLPPLQYPSLLWLGSLSSSLINLHPPFCLSNSPPLILQSLLSLLGHTCFHLRPSLLYTPSPMSLFFHFHETFSLFISDLFAHPSLSCINSPLLPPPPFYAPAPSPNTLRTPAFSLA